MSLPAVSPLACRLVAGQHCRCQDDGAACQDVWRREAGEDGGDGSSNQQHHVSCKRICLSTAVPTGDTFVRVCAGQSLHRLHLSQGGHTVGASTPSADVCRSRQSAGMRTSTRQSCSQPLWRACLLMRPSRRHNGTLVTDSVLSCCCCSGRQHPNIVQTYTYIVKPCSTSVAHQAASEE